MRDREAAQLLLPLEREGVTVELEEINMAVKTVRLTTWGEISSLDWKKVNYKIMPYYTYKESRHFCRNFSPFFFFLSRSLEEIIVAEKEKEFLKVV